MVKIVDSMIANIANQLRTIKAISSNLIPWTYIDSPKVVIPEVCKIGKILYVHLYREKWYRKVA